MNLSGTCGALLILLYFSDFVHFHLFFVYHRIVRNVLLFMPKQYHQKFVKKRNKTAHCKDFLTLSALKEKCPSAFTSHFKNGKKESETNEKTSTKQMIKENQSET